jgi:hypothetical protein
MGYRKVIDNIEVTGKGFCVLKRVFSKYGYQISKVYQVRRNRRVYMIELEHGKHLRLDIYGKGLIPYQNFYYQSLLYKNGLNVAKAIGLPFIGKKQGKISEWIEGVRVDEVWNNSEVFEKCGIELAKLNSTIDPQTDLPFALYDFSKLNLIWTKKKEVYIIDLNIAPEENVDTIVYKTLIMALRTPNRIFHFLRGYSKIRSISRILDIAIDKKWKWKNHGIIKDPSQDIGVD